MIFGKPETKTLNEYIIENKIKSVICFIFGHKWETARGYSVLRGHYTGRAHDVCRRCRKGEILQC